MIPDDCSELIGDLETEIGKFTPETHKPQDPNAPWHDIFLAARSLWTDYYAIYICAGRINCSVKTKVVAVLQKAHDTIPHDVDPRCHDQIREGIGDILMLASEIMEIERDA